MLLFKYLKYLIGVFLRRAQCLEDRAVEAFHFEWGRSDGEREERERETISFCVCVSTYILKHPAVAAFYMSIRA